MKSLCRVLCLAIVTATYTGCADPAAPDSTTTATPDNPQAGLDALKNMGGMPATPKKDGSMPGASSAPEKEAPKAK